MKLLKYVMTHDTGLAPNPFFGTCSLALCTPNHMNAHLNQGDWVVAHSSKETGRRLVYAMRLTHVLDMPTYFTMFPEKRPDPNGTYEQQCGDNMYYLDGDRWARMPSAEHNTPDAFAQDKNRLVYLAEGAENYWYFGAANRHPAIASFADRFPWLIKDRQGFSYIHDQIQITAFTKWLDQLGMYGLIGQPRDRAIISADSYLVSIDPPHDWIDPKSSTSKQSHSKGISKCRLPTALRRKQDCG